jgi:hypothetical protein
VLDDVDKQAFHPESLSTFQRLLLGMVARSHRLAVKATADSLEPVMYTVSLSGLGLAIPSATVTVLMQTVTEPGKAVARTTKVLQRLETQVVATDVQLAEATCTPVTSPEGKSNETWFVAEVWGQLKDKTSNGAERIAQATRAAVFATGQAAVTVSFSSSSDLTCAVDVSFAAVLMSRWQSDCLISNVHQVIGAITGAIGTALSAATTVVTTPITTFMLDQEAVRTS